MPPLLQFARYREIAAEVASRLAADAGEEVIVASGGLAASATAQLLALTESGVVSARLSMLDTFARRMLNDAGEYPRVANEAERRLAMRAAIDSITDPMMETRGIAAMMERSYRDVRDSAISVNEFERRVRQTSSLRNRARTEMIIRAWRAYEKLITGLPAVDPADLLERAATLIETGRAAVAPQIVAGFYDMTGAQLRILSALDDIGKLRTVLVPIGEGDAYAFASRFVKNIHSVLSPQSSVLHVKKAAAGVSQYDTKESELRGICEKIRELLDAGTPPNQIGIVTRSLDPDDVRLLQRFAGEVGFSITERLDTSLTAHRLGRGVTTILRLRGRNFPRADVIDILRDGYEPRKRVTPDWLDKATRKARISGGRAADVRNPSSDQAIDEYRDVLAELEALAPVREKASGETWAAFLNNAAARFQPETETDLTAAMAFDDIAALLGRWKPQVDAESVIELLEQTSLRRPPPAARCPQVWAGDVMKFRGRTFEHLFVFRAQENTFPQRRVDDPLLPDSDRRQLGIQEIGDGRDEERLLFQLLLDGATSSIQFSFAGSDTFGKILRPSRMLPPSTKEEGRKQKAEVILPNLPRQRALVARAGTRSVFDGYLGDHSNLRTLIAEKLQAVSPTQLEDFGECPQKFLLKHILGVVDYDDPDRELQMSHREKGKLDHTVLERFYRSGAAVDQIDALVDAAFEEEEARVPAFNRVMRQIERRATKRNLRAFLAEDMADLQANSLRPKHFEFKFGPKHLKHGPVDHPEPFIIRTRDVPIRVEGSIDRIDAGEEILRIVDYKSGKALRHVNLLDKIDRGVRLQLALYAMAVADFFDADKVSGAIKPLIVRGTDADKLRFDLGAVQGRLRETLDLFVDSMLRGAFPAFPNADDFDSCKYCPVNHSCRTKHSEAERRGLARDKDPRTLLETLS